MKRGRRGETGGEEEEGVGRGWEGEERKKGWGKGRG